MNLSIQEILQNERAIEIMQDLSDALALEDEKRKQFYANMTEQDKVEFINGQIVRHSPVKSMHNQCSLFLSTLLNFYVGKKELGYIGVEKVLIKLTRNDYEPDICFFDKEKEKQINPNTMFFPVPDFIVEILSPSTEKNDRGVKFRDYAYHGVKEYWIIDPEKQSIEQYLLQNNKREFELFVKLRDGIIESKVVEGFRIPVDAIFDRAENTKILAEMLKNTL
ncbi:MAG: Uma2 family endonuclease [Flammeovirgaceae bacterium]